MSFSIYYLFFLSGLPTEPSRAPKRAKVIPNGFSDGNIRPAPPQPAKNAPPTDKMTVERSSSDRRNDSPHAKSAPATKPRKAPEAARRTPILPPTDIAPPLPSPFAGAGACKRRRERRSDIRRRKDRCPACGLRSFSRFCGRCGFGVRTVIPAVGRRPLDRHFVSRRCVFGRLRRGRPDISVRKSVWYNLCSFRGT